MEHPVIRWKLAEMTHQVGSSQGGCSTEPALVSGRGNPPLAGEHDFPALPALYSKKACDATLRDRSEALRVRLSRMPKDQAMTTLGGPIALMKVCFLVSRHRFVVGQSRARGTLLEDLRVLRARGHAQERKAY